MRIGLIAGPWIPIPPLTYGGIERVVDTLARGFAAAGHDVLLAAPTESTCPVPLLPGMRPAVRDELGSTMSELSHVIRAYQGLQDVDIIHDHTLAGPLYAHRPAKVPVVTTIHGPLHKEAEDLYRAMARDVAIVAISRDQASHAPEVPVTQVIHHGMDVSAVPVGSGRGGYLCFVGRASHDKGLLEAITLARDVGMHLKIAVKMREPDEIRYFREVIEPMLGPNEDFVGEVDDATKYRMMGEATAFLNPIQWSEPFGLVMIEALATGTPVIGTRIGSAPEIVEHGRTGFLGKTGELQGFVEAAAGLSRERCRASVEDRFSAHRMVAQHLRLFDDLLAGRLPGGVPVTPPVHQNR
ncbi:MULTISPECIES: glycosyltransferase family 4 protein [Pseudarthrobacter]|uniref:Glycosyltransferase involved in cell wall biosynthesis n=1 Tax=Pseudarthrobacter niigatensis TaxID=369935 RepID=A0AAJ1WDV7_9MICC|nr:MULTISPECIES: glycosyltransferase family 4 protein [Pseudarthrobacter]MDQ0146624.1 glycosyltransferase involved in cell wall biosynthesis [Pseudarthrobacter niigatensis]MDQ0266789.1 glycosyltransferase involved in cell wall biosynthesis [Pseudarthrobacter niigatensis]QDG61176.1 glycosyltransferase family 4 protein [Pseudarthrobacter sp. NIBRBAC000502771]